MSQEGESCCAPGTRCGPDSAALDRREVIWASAVGAVGLATSSSWRAFAGPFDLEAGADFPIPADKKLDPRWIDSLFARGEPTVYRAKADLAHIGMPVGGIGCGQLYLGGDGKLWLWDIFNLPAPDDFRSGAGPHYADPLKPSSPIEQGFALRVRQGALDEIRRLDASGFEDIRFRGQYPIAFVEYRDVNLPVDVSLEAFSPFIPLDEDSSSTPATFLVYEVANRSSQPVEVSLAGWIENVALLRSGTTAEWERANRVTTTLDLALVECTLRQVAVDPRRRVPVVFEDFEKPTYVGWTATGTALGEGPIEKSKMPAYQGEVNAHGERLVNTHNARHGEDVRAADVHTGRLTSAPFQIVRRFISFRYGGGDHPSKTCLNLLIDGKIMRAVTGRNENRMHFENFDVREFEGRTAQIEIIDEESGGWGNVGVDEIVFCDEPRDEFGEVSERPDFGSLALMVLEGESDLFAAPALAGEGANEKRVFEPGTAGKEASSRERGLLGAVGRTVRLAPGEKARVPFVIAWHFATPWRDSLSDLTNAGALLRHYALRFENAAGVAESCAADFERLTERTRRWRRTFYENSSLPHWLLERSMANTSILATATCYRFNDGRFYGWEGTYCCPGTCTHVWNYAQAVARIFPGLERGTRERIDFGLAFHDDTGAIDYRAEAARSVAHDGQAGTIVRAWREHTMASDAGFLKRIWPRAKKAVEYLIGRDRGEDGILDGAQYNTLDAAWYGEIAWISSVYLAALRAGAAMAREMGDREFAARCDAIAERGSKNLVVRLFNGEYFVHRIDEAHPEANATGDGCHIDQVLGQSWAHQVGLPRVVPLEPSRSALKSLWKYSFAPDIGPYRKRLDERIQGGRWYAMPGEGGLLMCTWPKGGEARAAGKGGDAWAAGYFNECMTGFEHQVASHMLWEGLALEGLAITRAIHDRYHAARRNPWNEVECGDHYARSMASYGTYLAACGFGYHGPQAELAFAPRIRPENFRAAFTAAEGWGSLSQARKGSRQSNGIELAYGKLRLRTLRVELAEGASSSPIAAKLAGENLALTNQLDGRSLTITFAKDLVIDTGQRLELSIG